MTENLTKLAETTSLNSYNICVTFKLILTALQRYFKRNFIFDC